MGGSDILTYVRAKGLFAGMSLGGATLEPDADANQRLYGKEISAKEILLGNAASDPYQQGVGGPGCRPGASAACLRSLKPAE